MRDMHNHTERSFIDEFRWISPLPYLIKQMTDAVLLWCMLEEEPPFLHYYCAVVLHSCIVLPPVSHSSNYEYHCCQLTRQSSCVSNFYRTFKVFIWLSSYIYIYIYIYTHTHTHTHSSGLKEEASFSEILIVTCIRNYMVSKPKREKLPNYGRF